MKSAVSSHAAALPAWMTITITNRLQAEGFMRAAHDAGKLWHLDDRPTHVIDVEACALLARANECFEFCGDDPHEYCMFLSNRPASWRVLDDTLLAMFGEGLDPEQRECMDDPERREECLGMLDDMQARLGVPANVVQAVIAELDGDWQ